MTYECPTTRPRPPYLCKRLGIAFRLTFGTICGAISPVKRERSPAEMILRDATASAFAHRVTPSPDARLDFEEALGAAVALGMTRHEAEASYAKAWHAAECRAWKIAHREAWNAYQREYVKCRRSLARPASPAGS